MTIHERFPQLIEALRLGQNEFARAMGMSTAGVSNITRGVSEPSQKTLRKICEVFPQVNYAWLTTGEGPILLEVPEKVEARKEPATESAVLAELRELRREFSNMVSVIKAQQELLSKPTGNPSNTRRIGEKLRSLVAPSVALLPSF